MDDSIKAINPGEEQRQKVVNSTSVWWKRIKMFNRVATAIAALLIPLVGHLYTNAMKDKEIELRFVELSVGILNQEPSEDNRNLRDWATQIINRYSEIELSDSTKADLRERIILPISNVTEEIQALSFAVVGSFRQISEARLFAKKLESNGIKFKPEIYLAENDYYAVSLGGYLSKSEASRRVRYARDTGIAHDAYVWTSILWGRNLYQ